MVSKTQPRKVHLILGYISQDLADNMIQITRDAGMAIECIHLSKNLNDFLKSALTADAVFVQWDGRANTGHEIISNWAQGNAAPKGSVYAVTTSKIRVDTLAAKPSRLLHIAAWFDIPIESEKLKTELALLVPDTYDDFTSDLANCGLRMLADQPLPRLRGKHLIDEIKAAWDERAQRQASFKRGLDPSTQKHILLYVADQARSNELTQFLTENKFKYHDKADDAAKAIAFVRGHGTDCLLIWYDKHSESAELFLRMHLELRALKRIPVVVVVPGEEHLKTFRERASDIFVDKTILFDRNRERFRSALHEAFDFVTHESAERKILEELRAPAKENLTNTVAPDALQLEIACTQILSDPSKIYWSNVEHLMGYARLKDATKFDSFLDYFNSRYQTFDAAITVASARCQYLREEADAAIHTLVSRLPKLSDLSAERLLRAGVLAARYQFSQGMVNILELWWAHRDKWAIDHQFYFIASRFCSIKGFYALERSLLALAIRQDPLRSDYVEAYSHHLATTGHYGHVVKLCEYLLESTYFPRRKAMQMLIHAHIKIKNHTAALILIEEQLKQTPADVYLLGLRDKIQVTLGA